MIGAIVGVLRRADGGRKQLRDKDAESVEELEKSRLEGKEVMAQIDDWQ